MVVARNKGLLKQWFMLGHSPGCGCLCFLAGTCKATQNKNYLMLYYSIALLQTWEKKAKFFLMGLNFLYFCECKFILLIRNSPHISIPHKQRRTHLSRGHSLRKTPSSSIQSSIHFRLTFFRLDMLETLGNLPNDHSTNAIKGRGHSWNWDCPVLRWLINYTTVPCSQVIEYRAQVPILQDNLLCLIGMNVFWLQMSHAICKYALKTPSWHDMTWKTAR